MKLDFFKYHGTGNDFIMIDNRELKFPADNVNLISRLCDRRFGIGADGLILLENHDSLDFNMRYFNSDGNEASMCGNGGRCVVEFAASAGLINNSALFMAVDGDHEAERKNGLVKLKMKDISGVRMTEKGFFLDSGSPHLVVFRDELESIDILKEGRKLRYDKYFKPAGVNVNFCRFVNPDTIEIRTYERGVEGETYSCGTGSAAAAVAASVSIKLFGRKEFEIIAKGGRLKVKLDRTTDDHFENIFLEGPAEFVFSGTIEI